MEQGHRRDAAPVTNRALRPFVVAIPSWSPRGSLSVHDPSADLRLRDYQKLQVGETKIFTSAERVQFLP
jgi:hypothetical protein